MTHVVIIGAGLIGLSCADSLLARGADVTVLEAKPGPGEGASFCNSGMIHPSQALPWVEGIDPGAARDVAALARRSKELLLARMESLGLRDARRVSGSLQIFDGGSGLAEEAYTALGVSFEKVEPCAASFGRAALKFPEDRSGNAYDYGCALAADIAGRGGQIRYDVVDIKLSQDGHVFAAGRPQGADHVILAAGIGSQALAVQAGLDLPLFAKAGHALNFTRPDIGLSEVPVMHATSRSALTVFKDHVRLSGTTDQDGPDALLEIWRDITPNLVKALGEPIQSWTGQRPMCALGRPIICQGQTQGLWVNTGHAHMGWSLCTASGEVMAEMILDGREDARFGLR